MKWAVAAVCAYEATAITTGRVPTVTMLCSRSPLLGLAVTAGLVIHLYRCQEARP